jgi:hypothetical protein
MKAFLDIVEGIKDIVSEEFPGKKIFDKDVADLLGVSQMNFATMKRRNKVPLLELLDFCAKRSIAINWLLYGQSPESLIEPTNRFYAVRYFSQVNASAGGGAGNDDESTESLMLEANFVSSLGGESELKNIEAINVTGDSMEPTLNSENIIFIDKTKQDASKDGIYAFVNENGLFVKRIQRRVDGGLDIISDNKEYPMQIVNKDGINILGKVVSSIGKVF